MKKINFESSAVQSYLSSIQVIIARMASNSSSSKTWCITLASAIIAFSADKNKPESIWMAIIPITLFFLLDAYYLGIENQYISLYNHFVQKLHRKEAVSEDLFILSPQEKIFIHFLNAIISISVWPFYLLITVMLFVLYKWIF